MKNFIQFGFNNHPIHVIDNDTGQPWYLLADICKDLNLMDPSAVAGWLDDNEKSNPKPHSKLRKDQLLINEAGLFAILLRSSSSAAKKFKKWLTSEALPSISSNGSYSAHSITIRSSDNMIFEMAINTIKSDPASKITMLKKPGEERGHSMNYLPEYVEAPDHHESLTRLIKENHCPLTPVTVNKILISLGLLETKTRPSSKGHHKQYKEITKDGRRFGLNLVSPKSPNETQPHWYVETFPELLEIVLEKYYEFM